MNSAWPEYVQLDTCGTFTRGDSRDGAVPAAESENGREQRQCGNEPIRRAGSRPCANCDEGFEPSVHSSHNQKYCSYRCRNEAKAKRRTAIAPSAPSADQLFCTRSHDAEIGVKMNAGNVITTHEHADEFKEW